MKRKILIATILLLVSIAGFFCLFRASSFDPDIAKIEALPATVMLSKNREMGSQGATLIRVIPGRPNSQRNFNSLATNTVLGALKGFDACDCIDFGDKELDLIKQAQRIEYLGLDGTSITDVSLANMADHWPSLQFLDVEACNVSQKAILNLLQVKKLVFIEISEELNDEAFRDQVRKISPNTIVMCDGKDVLEHPDSAFESIPWSNWE